MCLNTNQISSHKAKKDIECYKVLILEEGVDVENKEMVYSLHSPLYGEMSWEIGKVYKDDKFLPLSSGEKQKGFFSLSFSNRVQYGYHTYKHLKDAFNLIGGTHCYKIFKAIIPEGSQCFEGWVNGAYDIFGYASNQLKLIKQINP